MKNKNYLIKTLAAFVLAIAVCLPASAQKDEEISTIFGDKDGHVDHGGWGGLSFGYTKLKDLVSTQKTLRPT